MFLMGPMAQLKRMFDKGRWIATAVYLSSLLLTLVAAYVVRLLCGIYSMYMQHALKHNLPHQVRVGLLVLICLVFQLGALAWYSLSYIPFARQALMGLLGAGSDGV